MSVQERLIKYCKINTQSDPNSENVPSTQRQFDLANHLKKEMEDMGMVDVVLTEQCYLYGTIPSNMEEEVETIGFIAHLDTAPDFSGENVNPQFIENYDGQDIQLNHEVVMSQTDFPFMKRYVGKDLIVTDGTTLLGADDKAGIAEILEACDILLNNPDAQHGTIKIAFTPDEEIGRGAEHFDVAGFGCDFAYTLDGGSVDIISDETFNAASATVKVKGFSIHPGSAKDKMINALNIAHEFHALLPKDARPETTEGREGFYHLTDLQGCVEEATLHYILRNHDLAKLELQKESLSLAETYINKKYKKDLIEVEIQDSYRNMYEILKDNPRPIEVAKQALSELGIDVSMESIRGGTDGATLTFKGLPCPNLGTGGGNFHGRYEYCCVQEMEQAVLSILNIIRIIAVKETV